MREIYKNTSLTFGGKLGKIKNKAEPKALSYSLFLENDAEAFQYKMDMKHLYFVD